MTDKLPFAFGVMGNATSLLLYSSPILTFSRVIRKKSTEGFSCVPYIVTLLNCLVITWYASPFVSIGWERFPVVTINGLGIVLQLSFVLIYSCFASPTKTKIRVARMAVPTLLVFCSIVVTSAFGFHDHHHRKLFVGSIALLTSVALYTAPLVAVKEVIRTKSVEFMPFYLSLFTFLNSSCWLVYGSLCHDIFLMVPNMVGVPLGISQLVVYYKYRKGKKVKTPPKGDASEKNNPRQLEIVITDTTATTTNGKI